MNNAESAGCGAEVRAHGCRQILSDSQHNHPLTQTDTHTQASHHAIAPLDPPLPLQR